MAWFPAVQGWPAILSQKAEIVDNKAIAGGNGSFIDLIKNTVVQLKEMFFVADDEGFRTSADVIEETYLRLA